MSRSMDFVPRIRVKKELFSLMLSSKVENQEVDRASNWKKALLTRDLDLVQAGIKIIMAMPTNSRTILNLGKTIHASLKDVEAILLHNQLPVRRLDLSSSSSLPQNKETHTDAYSAASPWRKALLARNMDLVHTCVHAIILLDLPRRDRIELAETAFAALKDLHGIILKDDVSSHQIAHYSNKDYKLNDSERNADLRKSFDNSSQTQNKGKRQNVVKSQILTESENHLESQIPLHHVGDPSYSEEPQNTARPARAKTPRNQKEPQNIVEPQSKPSSSEEKVPQNHVETQKVSSVSGLTLDVPIRVSQEKGGSPPTLEESNSLPSTLLCCICECRLTDGRCVSCINFALKMESSMKQKVFYECSHAENSGGVDCKVCRYSLILTCMPNYASEKKIQVVHKQIGPRSKTVQNNNPNVKMQQANENGTHETEVIELGRPSQNVSETTNFISNKIPHPALIAPENSEDTSILISNVTSLSALNHRVTEGMASSSKSAPSTQNACVVCKSRASPDGKCRACAAFAQRIEDLMEKDIFYECSHVNFSGGSKCRVCRYNQIVQLQKDREQNKVLPWSNY